MVVRILFVLGLVLRLLRRLEGAVIEESYLGVVTADDILYTHVVVPRHAYEVSISIWREPTEAIVPVVLLKYDSLPSPEDYDELLTFQDLSNTMEIIDHQPTAATLYLGIWGGELMHSYRYFAGSPASVGISIKSKVLLCDNELELYNFRTETCELLTILTSGTNSPSSTPFSTIITGGEGYEKRYSLIVPSYTYSTSVLLAAHLNNTSAWCSLITSDDFVVILGLEIYLDQKQEELNYFEQIKNYSLRSICTQREDLSVTVTIPLPANGLWIVSTFCNLSTPSSPEITIPISLNLTTHQVSLNLNSKVPAVFSDYEFRALQARHDQFWFYTYRSDPVMFDRFPAPLRAIYAIDLTSAQYQLVPNGKSSQLTVQIDYHVNSSQAQNPHFLQRLQSQTYVLSARLGNIPYPTNNYDIDRLFQSIQIDFSEAQRWKYQATNLFELLTSQAQQTMVSIPHNNNHWIIRIIYNWNLVHPKLAVIHGIFTSDLYFLLSQDGAIDESSVSRTEAAGGSSIPSFVDYSSFFGQDVTFNMITGYCAPNTCAHGVCMIRSNFIMTSECYCKYPWAGERCDQLSVSDWFYHLQVFLLTFSNIAMIPAILFAYLQELYLITTGLFFAMIASMIYHLCDTDYYCIWDLSFESLQVFDILFCNVMVTSVLIFYAPISERTHNILLLMIFGILLSFTVNNPTSPINLVFSFSLAALVDSVTWIYYWWRRQGRSNTLFTRSRGMYGLLPSSVMNITSSNILVHPKSGQKDRISPLSNPNKKYTFMEVRRRGGNESKGRGKDGEEEKMTKQTIELTRKRFGRGELRPLTTTSIEGNDDFDEDQIENLSPKTLMNQQHQQSIAKIEEEEEEELAAETEEEADKAERKSLFYFHRHRRYQAFTKSSVSTAHRYDLDDFSTPSDSLQPQRLPSRSYSWLRQVCTCLFQVLSMILGMICGIIGLLCFILQSRENYWIYHSSWHTLVMLACYFLLKGKYEFFEWIQFQPLQTRWFEEKR